MKSLLLLAKFEIPLPTSLESYVDMDESASTNKSRKVIPLSLQYDFIIV